MNRRKFLAASITLALAPIASVTPAAAPVDRKSWLTREMIRDAAKHSRLHALIGDIWVTREGMFMLDQRGNWQPLTSPTTRGLQLSAAEIN